jgi:hypothetical protein
MRAEFACGSRRTVWLSPGEIPTLPPMRIHVDISVEPNSSGILVTVVHSGLSALRVDRPARHGNQGAAFSRMMGLWWGEQMSALRQFCRESL